MLLGNPTGMPLYQNYFNAMPGQIETLRKRIAEEKDPAAKAKLQTQLGVTENNYASQKELKPTPPNVTLSTHMTLFRGSARFRSAISVAATQPAMSSCCCRRSAS
jgi:hypothetical protein